ARAVSGVMPSPYWMTTWPVAAPSVMPRIGGRGTTARAPALVSVGSEVWRASPPWDWHAVNTRIAGATRPSDLRSDLVCGLKRAAKRARPVGSSEPGARRPRDPLSPFPPPDETPPEPAPGTPSRYGVPRA